MGNVFSNFFSRLAGSGGGDAAEAEIGEEVEYKGYGIRPAPRREGSEWLTAGIISKQVGDELKEHHFVRVDKHMTKDSADEFSIVKAKQIIDEQGDNLFRDR